MIIAYDTETYPFIKRGKATKHCAPQPVAFTWATEDGLNTAAPAWPAQPFGQLVHARDGLDLWLSWLSTDDVVVGHNVAFDDVVMLRYAQSQLTTSAYDETVAALFRAYEEARRFDTMWAEALHQISTGGLRGSLSLAALVDKYLGVEVEGKGGLLAWRTRYNELDDVPVDQWPAAAVDYARKDAEYTLAVYKAQRRYANEQWQCMAAFGLQLMQAWGLRVDPAWTQAVDAFYEAEEERLAGELTRAGIMVGGTVKAAKKEALFAAAWEGIGAEPVLTPTGKVSTSRATLEELEALGAAESPTFRHYVDYNRVSKYRATWIEAMLDAGHGPLCPSYWACVNSGRTSAREPNVQNFPSRPRKEDTDAIAAWAAAAGLDGDDPDARVMGGGVVTGPDIRGCFVPRDGAVFVGADYSALELATLAQVVCNWLGGVTALGGAINNGDDLHCRVAAQLLGVTYEECVRLVEAGDPAAKRARSVSKIANYSFPVGAAASTFRVQARSQGVDMTLDEAEAVRTAWYATWPEIAAFDDRVHGMQTGYDGAFFVEQHGPHGQTYGWRMRRCEKKTEAANSLFQGLAADGAKAALWLLVTACYVDKTSPLYGCRMPLFVHDEFVLEVPGDVDPDAAGAELSRLMVKGMRMFTPNVRIEADYDIMETRWSK